MSVKKLAVASILAISASLVFAQSSTVINGFVSDSQCGAQHAKAGEKDSACAKGCVKRGSAPVLVSDGKVYKLKGDDATLKSLAGEEVTVKGTVAGDTITVTSISAQKS